MKNRTAVSNGNEAQGDGAGLKLQIKKELCCAPVLIDAHIHTGISFKAYVQNEYPYGLSFEDLILRMDCLDIDKACVFPFPASAFYQVDKNPGLTLKTTRKFSGCPYELENRNLLNEIFAVFPESSRRALPFLMFDPSRCVPAQIAVLEELVLRYPVFGLKTCTHQIKAFIRDLPGKGRPIIDFARRHNLPVLCHASYFSGDPWANVYDILDVAERFPDVRFGVAHMARFTADALERAHALPNCFVDLSAFLIHCRLACENGNAIPPAENRFRADYKNPLNVLRRLIEQFPGTLIWGSDMPFNFCFTRMRGINGEEIVRSLKSAFQDEYKLISKLNDADLKHISYHNTLCFLFGGNNRE